jgi:hypothetical protein
MTRRDLIKKLLIRWKEYKRPKDLDEVTWLILKDMIEDLENELDRRERNK